MQTTERRRVSADGQTIVEQHVAVSPARWSFGIVVALLGLSSKLARVSLALEMDRVTITRDALAALSDEELERLVAV